MAVKCRICGYRFKPGDGSICPECFTAREDELKFLGSEFKRSDIFGRDRKREDLGSFLADEMREEKHEDISMKKALDREDAVKTRDFASQGANVKNESYRDAFRERVSRDRSEQGRVYTDRKSAGTTGSTASTQNNKQLNSFLDSIDPTLRERIYNNTSNQNTDYRYSHHTSNQQQTSNQQMLYGVNGGRTPGANSTSNNNNTVIYNFPKRDNYKKGSGAKAVAVMIVSIAIFSIFIGIASSMDELSNDDDTEKRGGIDSVEIVLPDISMPDIPNISIPDINIPDLSDDPLTYKLYTKYGNESTLYLLDYQKGDIIEDALTDDAKNKLVYPEESLRENLREVTLVFYVDGIGNENDIPELESMTLISESEAGAICVSYSYDVQIDTANLLNNQYQIFAKFIIPDGISRMGLDIYYNTESEPQGYAYINKFSYKVLDAWNGRESDDTSEPS